MILFGVILFFVIVAIVLSKTETPVYLDGQNKPITTQDSFEDVVTDEKTIHIKTHDRDRSKEIVVDIPISAPFDKPINYDLMEKEITHDPITEEFNNTVGGKELTEHIASVIKLNPNSKKHLNKRQRKTVDKIVKEI